MPRLAHAALSYDHEGAILRLRIEMEARERREQRRFWLLAILLTLVLLTQLLPWVLLPE